jgi:hypothetical protein
MTPPVAAATADSLADSLEASTSRGGAGGAEDGMRAEQQEEAQEDVEPSEPARSALASAREPHEGEDVYRAESGTVTVAAAAGKEEALEEAKASEPPMSALASAGEPQECESVHQAETVAAAAGKEEVGTADKVDGPLLGVNTIVSHSSLDAPRTPLQQAEAAPSTSTCNSPTSEEEPKSSSSSSSGLLPVVEEVVAEDEAKAQGGVATLELEDLATAGSGVGVEDCITNPAAEAAAEVGDAEAAAEVGDAAVAAEVRIAPTPLRTPVESAELDMCSIAKDSSSSGDEASMAVPAAAGFFAVGEEGEVAKERVVSSMQYEGACELETTVEHSTSATAATAGEEEEEEEKEGVDADEHNAAAISRTPSSQNEVSRVGDENEVQQQQGIAVADLQPQLVENQGWEPSLVTVSGSVATEDDAAEPCDDVEMGATAATEPEGRIDGPSDESLDGAPAAGAEGAAAGAVMGEPVVKKPRKLRPIKNTKKLVRVLSDGLANGADALLRRTSSNMSSSLGSSSSSGVGSFSVPRAGSEPGGLWRRSMSALRRKDSGGGLMPLRTLSLGPEAGERRGRV